MKILDRYILVKYITTFLFCLLLLTTIVVVIDVSEHTDDFAKTKLPAWRIVTDYYFGFIPRIDAMLFPLFIFISVIFFTSKMAGRSEIIAILSSGVSYHRFMVPYFIGGFLMSFMLWLGYQYVVPKANRKWGEFEKNYIDVNGNPSTGSNVKYRQNIYFRLDADTWMGIKGYDTATKSGNNMFVQKFRNNAMVYNLRATSFNWDSTKGKWKLTNVIERQFNAIDEKVHLIPYREMNYNFKPIDLRKDDYLKDQMVTSELNEFIRKEQIRGSDSISSLLVEKYNRDAIPFSVFILTVIGAVISARKIRGGSGAHLALGVIISVVYVLFSRLSVVFATKGDFSPLLAAWLPNILFGLLAFYLYRKAPK